MNDTEKVMIDYQDIGNLDDYVMKAKLIATETLSTAPDQVPALVLDIVLDYLTKADDILKRVH